MKRPEMIQTDVWEKLTVNDAAKAGLLGSVPAEWLIVGGSSLLCDADDTALVARMLDENISVKTAMNACASVRMRKQKEKKTGAMNRPERIPEDVWQTLTVGEAVEFDLLGETALEYEDPARLCSTLERTGVLAKCLAQNVDNDHPMNADNIKRRIHRLCQDRASRLERSESPNRISMAKLRELYPGEADALAIEQDVRARLHAHSCPNCYEKWQCCFDCTIEPDLGTTRSGLPLGSHARCDECGPEPEEPEPEPVALREDICPNDRPLLSAYEWTRIEGAMENPSVAHGPVDMRGVGRLYVTVKDSKCSVRTSIAANDPNGYALNWNDSSNNKMRRAVARYALRFDLAVRTGELDAVGAYGLILFALAVRTEHEQKQALAAMGAADSAMHAVMTTVGRMTEEQ